MLLLVSSIVAVPDLNLDNHSAEMETELAVNSIIPVVIHDHNYSDYCDSKRKRD